MNINNIIHNPLFESVEYKQGQILYHEGESDPYIYVVISGRLSIDKYTDISKSDMKHLAIIESGGIIGEAGMMSDDQKQVTVSSKSDTILLRIDAKKGMKDFIEQYPSDGFEFMKYIISQTNNRLLKANSQITATYKITKAISNLDIINLKSIFSIIDTACNVLGSDYILYVEKNPVLSEYYNIIYNTQEAGKKSSIVVESSEDQLQSNILSEIQHDPNISHCLHKINVGEKILGYFIFGSKKGFNENDTKIIEAICSSISGIIQKYTTQIEEQNKSSLN